MEPDDRTSRFRIGFLEPQMNITLKHPDTETVNRQLAEAVADVEAAMLELEHAQSVSRQILDGMISL